MGYKKVSDRRKMFIFLLAQAGVPFRTIVKRDQTRFGTTNKPVAVATINAVHSIGKLTGDPCFKCAAYNEGKTLTYAHKKLHLVPHNLHTLH